MQLTYRDSQFDEVMIDDVETATLDQLNDAYTYLLDMGYTDDFPGSAAWKAAKVYSDQLSAMLAIRPEVEQYRKEKAAAKRRERLAGKDILGL